MDRILAFSAVFVLLLSSCGGGKPRIRGELRGLPDSRVFLTEQAPEGEVAIDSAMSRKGKFSIKVPDITADILYIVTEDGMRIPIVITGEDVRVAGDLNYREDPVVSGTHENELLASYRAMAEPLTIRSEAAGRELVMYSDSISSADSVAYFTLLREYRNIQGRLAQLRADFVRENPSSIVAAMVVAGELSSTTTAPQADSLLGTLDTGGMTDNVFLRRLMAAAESSGN